MRLSHISVAYFLMGTIVVASGVLPVAQMGIGTLFVDVGDQGVTANGTSVGGQGGQDGLLDNLIGPVKNALNTISGGSLLAVWGAVSKVAGFYAWPVVATNAIGAPWQAVMISGVMVMTYTFAILRVLRASI